MTGNLNSLLQSVDPQWSQTTSTVFTVSTVESKPIHSLHSVHSVHSGVHSVHSSVHSVECKPRWKPNCSQNCTAALKAKWQQYKEKKNVGLAMLNSDDFNVKLMIINCPSPILATNDVAAALRFIFNSQDFGKILLKAMISRSVSAGGEQMLPTLPSRKYKYEIKIIIYFLLSNGLTSSLVTQHC